MVEARATSPRILQLVVTSRGESREPRTQEAQDGDAAIFDGPKRIPGGQGHAAEHGKGRPHVAAFPQGGPRQAQHLPRLMLAQSKLAPLRSQHARQQCEATARQQKAQPRARLATREEHLLKKRDGKAAWKRLATFEGQRRTELRKLLQLVGAQFAKETPR